MVITFQCFIKNSIFLLLIFIFSLCRLIAEEKQFNTKAEFYEQLIKQQKCDGSVRKITGVSDRKKSILNVGNVEARIRNTGTFGYDQDGKCYEIPAGSGLTYRWTMGVLVGYKMEDGTKVVANGTFGAARDHQDEFEPISGLDAGWSDTPANNYGIAASDRPDTWPDEWPTDKYMPVIGSKGFPGYLYGEVMSTRELYYAAVDDSNDVNPGNIRIDVWGNQSHDFINEDFIVYKIRVTNISDQPMRDVYLGIHDDPDCPEQGTDEWKDDFAAFIPEGTDVEAYNAVQDTLLWDFIYLWDGDDQVDGLIDSKVGWVGLKFMQNDMLVNDPCKYPESKDHVSTFSVFNFNDAPQSEELAYDQLASGIQLPDNIEPHPFDWTQTPNTYGPDITYVAAKGPYNLEPDEWNEIVVASIHGVNKKDLFNNAMLAEILTTNQYSSPYKRLEKKGILDVGNVVARIQNSAILGSYAEKCYEYPKGSGISYRKFLCPQVILANDFEYYNLPGWPPYENIYFKPYGGLAAKRKYDDENYSLAMSDRPDTWPDEWPDDLSFLNIGTSNFPGVKSGEVVADREIYFAATDCRVRLDTWCLQFKDSPNADFIVYNMDITNITEDVLTDIHLGVLDKPICPVPRHHDEYPDDFASVIYNNTDMLGYSNHEDSLLWNFVYYWDGNDYEYDVLDSNICWTGFKFLGIQSHNLQSIEKMDINTFKIQNDYFDTGLNEFPTGIDSPENIDPHPGDWTQTPNTYGPGKFAYLATSGPYSLQPDESITFAFASVHGLDKDDLFKNAIQCQKLYDSLFVNSDTATTVTEKSEISDNFILKQNYPNPFNESTIIQYQLPNDLHITVKIYDLLGRELVTLVDQKQNVGLHTVRWNANELASGVYICKIDTGEFSETKKLVLLR